MVPNGATFTRSFAAGGRGGSYPEFVAADLVVQQEYLEPGARLVRQYPAQPPAEVIVADNVELEQDIVFRRRGREMLSKVCLPSISNSTLPEVARMRARLYRLVYSGYHWRRHDVLLDQPLVSRFRRRDSRSISSRCSR